MAGDALAGAATRILCFQCKNCVCSVKTYTSNSEKESFFFSILLSALLLKLRMGSVRHRLSEPRHDCNVVLVGDCRVGKSALVNRFINNKFVEVSLRLV